MVFVLLIVAPIVEIFVLIQTGHAIGGWNTLGLVILVAVVGVWLIKREGIKVWRRFGEQVRAGQVPSKEIADGVLLLIAGALFIAPGFISDFVALLILFPPTRALFRKRLLKRTSFGGGFGGGRIIRATYRGPMPDPHGSNITDTTATETRGELEP